MSRQKIVILDLDNTIADDGWRIGKINWQKHGDERYHDYHTLAPFDKCANKHLFERQAELGRKILIMTARPVMFAAATEHWLRTVAGIERFDICMRNNGERATSDQIKYRRLMEMLAFNDDFFLEDIVSAYDDHQGVIDMYRSLGIQAERVSIHDKDAFHDPVRNIAAA